MPVNEVALSILNADSAGDNVLKASLRFEMLGLLDDLRKSHGDHPVLLETMADYLEDVTERAALYRRSVDLAELHRLPTLSIRLSFARLLVDVGEPATALEELRACGDELPGAKEDEQAWWEELLKEAGPTA